MHGVFRFHLYGTCTHDPEFSTLPNGTKRATINVAVNRPYQKDDGTWEQTVCFARVAKFGKAAEAKHLTFCRKGTPVFIEGDVTSYFHETEQGKKLTMYNFRPDTIRPGGRPPEGSGQADPGGGGDDAPPDDDNPEAMR